MPPLVNAIYSQRVFSVFVFIALSQLYVFNNMSTHIIIFMLRE